MMQTTLDIIAAEAVRRADDYTAFAHYVELQELSDEALDSLVERIAAPIIEAIDCTQCANCCRHLNIYLTESDGKRLAEAIDVPLSSIIDHERAHQQDEWGMFIQKPCRFLDGNLCSIYPHRPESCRIYPVFTPNFRWTIDMILEGVGLCPIIYNVIETLQDELGW
jgi:Fe-S-cluster containining protein